MIFLPEVAVFLYYENVFFKECFIKVNGNKFSGLYKPLFMFLGTTGGESFFLLSKGNVFLNETFISAIGEGFFSSGARYFI